VIVRLHSRRLLARTTTSVFLLQITWEPGKTHQVLLPSEIRRARFPTPSNPPGTQMAGQKVPSSKNSPLSQALATLSGAMLAAAFGWHLVNSSRRRISLGVGT
jgi:hypothetical protein